MSISTTPHLNLPGTARAALDVYRGVFGGEVSTTTYGELGMPDGSPDADKVVFGSLSSEDGVRLMAYDIPGRENAFPSDTRRENGATLTDQPSFLSASAASLEELQPIWDGLAEGARVIEPLAASAWSAGFGMLTDRFGVTWSLDVRTAA
ncbi:VOC family protein [Brachybacterium sp. NPDC056505]|uniref:VOC family protein n=1 Tax=Brachybacterium sp. NPDC056505 TaxID=3345843 RepID=UPI00366CE9F3